MSLSRRANRQPNNGRFREWNRTCWACQLSRGSLARVSVRAYNAGAARRAGLWSWLDGLPMALSASGSARLSGPHDLPDSLGALEIAAKAGRRLECSVCTPTFMGSRRAQIGLILGKRPTKNSYEKARYWGCAGVDRPVSCAH